MIMLGFYNSVCTSLGGISFQDSGEEIRGCKLSLLLFRNPHFSGPAMTKNMWATLSLTIAFIFVFMPTKRLFYDSLRRTDFRESIYPDITTCQEEFDANFSPNLNTLMEFFKRDELPRRLARLRCKQQTWWTVGTHRYFLTMILLLAGDISMNPGPRKLAYPCGICKYAVSQRQRAIQCDKCDFWIHLKCIPSMTVKEYHDIAKTNDPWFCLNCLAENNLNRISIHAEELIDINDGLNNSQFFNFTDSFFINHNPDIDNDDGVQSDSTHDDTAISNETG